MKKAYEFTEITVGSCAVPEKKECVDFVFIPMAFLNFRFIVPDKLPSVSLFLHLLLGQISVHLSIDTM